MKRDLVVALALVATIALGTRLWTTLRPPTPLGPLDWRALRVNGIPLETAERDLGVSDDGLQHVPSADADVRVRDHRAVLIDGKQLSLDSVPIVQAGDSREDVMARLGPPTAGEHCAIWYRIGFSVERKDEVWLLISGHDEVHRITLFFNREDPT